MSLPVCGLDVGIGRGAFVDVGAGSCRCNVRFVCFLGFVLKGGGVLIFIVFTFLYFPFYFVWMFLFFFFMTFVNCKNDEGVLTDLPPPMWEVGEWTAGR